MEPFRSWWHCMWAASLFLLSRWAFEKLHRTWRQANTGSKPGVTYLNAPLLHFPTLFTLGMVLPATVYAVKALGWAQGLWLVLLR